MDAWQGHGRGTAGGTAGARQGHGTYLCEVARVVLEHGVGALHRHRHHGGVDALGGRECAPCARRLHEGAEGHVQQLLRVEEAAPQVLQLDGQLDEVVGA